MRPGIIDLSYSHTVRSNSILHQAEDLPNQVLLKFVSYGA
jgi:hypothetical protein